MISQNAFAKPAKSVLAALLAVALVPFCPAPHAYAAQNDSTGSDSSSGEPAQLLVQFEEGYRPLSVMSEAGVASSLIVEQIELDALDEQPVNVVEVPADKNVDDVMASLASKPGVKSVQKNFEYRLLEDKAADGLADAIEQANQMLPQSTEVNDPAAQSTNASDPANQWYLRSTNVFEAWDEAKCENEVSIAVLDTGALMNHEDLVDNIDYEHAWDIRANATLERDLAGHGTHVAGILGAKANNGKGIAGAAYNPNIIPVNVFTSDVNGTVCYTEDLIKAYNYLLGLEDLESLNLHVINMSLGGYYRDENDDLFEAAIKRAEDEANIVTVAAGGNGDDYGNPLTEESYPSDFDEVVSVVCLQDDTTRVSWSDYNEHKNIAAPGVNIYSCLYNGPDSYGKKSGTSMASPLVAGITALMFAASPDLTAADAKAILYETAQDLGTPGFDPYYGWGKVDALAAVMAAKDAATSRISIADAVVTVDQSTFVYNGSPCKPGVSVTLNGTLLVEGTDYRVSYSSNVSAGAAKVIVYGKGDYSGKVECPFTIEKSSALTVSADDVSFGYDGLSHSLSASASDKADTTVTYKNEYGAYTDESPEYVNAGEYTVEFKAENPNYQDAYGSATLIINPRAVTVTVSNGSKVFGSADPAVSCTVAPALVSPNDLGRITSSRAEADMNKGNVGDVIHLAAAYQENSNYEVTVVEGTLKITPASIAASSAAEIADQAYTGSAVCPELSLSFNGAALESGVDYTVQYEDNVEVGMARAVVTGIGNFRGTKFVSFRISESVTPKPGDSDDDVVTEQIFDDVPLTHWLVTEKGNYLGYVVNRNLMTGYTGTNDFGPEDNLTRGQVATILYRAANPNAQDTLPGHYATSSSFDDVEGGMYYTAAIEWCRVQGISSGYSGTNSFGPNDLVTREQLSKMIALYASYACIDIRDFSMDKFSAIDDASDTSDWAVPYMAWCVDKGILSGVLTESGPRLMPTDCATRAQMAKMITVALRDVMGYL